VNLPFALQYAPVKSEAVVRSLDPSLDFKMFKVDAGLISIAWFHGIM